MRNLFMLLAFIGFCGLIITYQLHSTGDQFEKLKNEGTKAIGVIERSNRGITYSYQVGNEFYHRSQSSFPRGIIDGERFAVYYDKNDPDVSVIDLYDPVFSSANFTAACAYNFKVWDGSKRGLVSYNYEVNGQEFERYQYARHGRLSTGGRLKVVYKFSDPSIAYLVRGSCEASD